MRMRVLLITTLFLLGPIIPAATFAKNAPSHHTAHHAVTEARIPILMYHYIGPMPAKRNRLGRGLTVTAEHFASQLQYLKDHGFQTIDFDDLHAGTLSKQPIILTFDDGYSDAYTDAFPQLKKNRMKAVFFIVTHFVGQSGYMDGKQIQEMALEGMQMGAHTLDHKNLAILSAKKQRMKVDGSIRDLEKMLKSPVHVFAYPPGCYTGKTLNIVQKEGLWYGVTTHHGFATLSSRPLELPRIRVKDATSLQKILAKI